MIFFTSDLHLGHANVISFAHRPFAGLEDMNRTIINNYNSIVTNEDTVYLLGDITFKLHVDEANEIISRLNGRKYLIRGNHDRKYDESLFEDILIYNEISDMGKHIVMMHYPIMDWKRRYHGSIHVHGHIHSEGLDYNLENKKNGIFRYDVGVDANSYYPVAITTVIDFFNMPLP